MGTIFNSRNIVAPVAGTGGTGGSAPDPPISGDFCVIPDPNTPLRYTFQAFGAGGNGALVYDWIIDGVSYPAQQSVTLVAGSPGAAPTTLTISDGTNPDFIISKTPILELYQLSQDMIIEPIQGISLGGLSDIALPIYPATSPIIEPLT